MSLKHIAFGISCYLPGVYNLVARWVDPPMPARYGYAVWMRHLVRAHQHGIAGIPHTVAEPGLGYSPGAGLAALLSGAERYVAVDVPGCEARLHNLKLFDELVALFEQRADIPDAAEFPRMQPALDAYAFPKDLLTEAHLARTLAADRVAALRQAVSQPDAPDSPLRRVCPLTDPEVLEPHSVDMIFSQAVLEHVDDLETVYRAFSLWLKPKGWMSHTIDFTCHNTSKVWNGHWTIGDGRWGLMRGGRPYLLNRQPHSAHLQLLRETDFKILLDQRLFNKKKSVARKDLTLRFEHLTDEDLKTQGAFILAAAPER